jgi:hypothetical protein
MSTSPHQSPYLTVPAYTLTCYIHVNIYLRSPLTFITPMISTASDRLFLWLLCCMASLGLVCSVRVRFDGVLIINWAVIITLLITTPPPQQARQLCYRRVRSLILSTHDILATSLTLVVIWYSYSMFITIVCMSLLDVVAGLRPITYSARRLKSPKN